jgi:hypothetical protein
MKCDDAARLLPLQLYGELSFDDDEFLEQHLDGCQSCRAERKRTQALHRSLDGFQPDVDQALLANCRRNLRLALPAAHEPVRPHRRWFGWLRPGWVTPAGAVALLAIGFISARLIPFGAGPATVYAPGSASNSPVASRVRYVEPGPEGRVQIVVDETRQRTLSGQCVDDSIRKLLVNAAREASDPGLRVESMELLNANAGSNTDVRSTLLYAFQHDPNSGVRLKALQGLKRAFADAEVRRALSRAVLSDDNPGVRTQAIDLLVQKREPAMAGVLQEVLRKEDNTYIRLRCQTVLHEMRPSEDTF